MDDALSHVRSQGRLHLLPLRNQSADLLSLVASLRPTAQQSGGPHVSSATAPPTPWTVAQADAVLAFGCAYPRWRKGQTHGPAPPSISSALPFDGRLDSQRSEAVRRAGRSSSCCGSGAAVENVQSALGRPKAPFLAHAAARGPGSTRHLRTPPRAHFAPARKAALGCTILAAA
jgi:hypothetical protein